MIAAECKTSLSAFICLLKLDSNNISDACDKVSTEKGAAYCHLKGLIEDRTDLTWPGATARSHPRTSMAPAEVRVIDLATSPANAAHRAWIATVRAHRRAAQTTWTRTNPTPTVVDLDPEAARRLAEMTTAVAPRHHASESAK